MKGSQYQVRQGYPKIHLINQELSQLDRLSQDTPHPDIQPQNAMRDTLNKKRDARSHFGGQAELHKDGNLKLLELHLSCTAR